MIRKRLMWLGMCLMTMLFFQEKEGFVRLRAPTPGSTRPERQVATPAETALGGH